jgi:hypothetical protein
MKAGISLILLFGLTGCVATKEPNPIAASTTNLTEQEIRSLPAGITFKEIKSRLRYYTGSEVAIPLISFEIEGEKGKECMMLFEEKTNRLLYALASAQNAGSEDDMTVLWPANQAGKKALDLLREFELKKEANKRTTDNSGASPLRV